MRDCEILSENAKKIFEKLKQFFPPDPWGRTRWLEEGKVFDNSWFDLTKAADRQNLKNKLQSTIGYIIMVTASGYRQGLGTLVGFDGGNYSHLIRNNVGLLLILNDLDFQIETGDLVD